MLSEAHAYEESTKVFNAGFDFGASDIIFASDWGSMAFIEESKARLCTDMVAVARLLAAGKIELTGDQLVALRAALAPARGHLNDLIGDRSVRSADDDSAIDWKHIPKWRSGMRDSTGRRIYVIDFYKQHYAALHEAGLLHGVDVKKHDPLFYQTLASWVSNTSRRDPNFTMRLGDLMVVQTRWVDTTPDGVDPRRDARACALRALDQAHKLITGGPGD